MRLSRILMGLTALAASVTVSACGSSKSTGPSTGPKATKLAAVFDSSYRADSAAGSSRSTFDALVLIPLNEGATPTAATVATDGGALSMQMVAAVVYDTASGAIVDSSVIVFGWTADYSTEVITVLAGVVGPDLVPPHRIEVSAGQMATIRALTRRLSAGHVASRSGSTSAEALVFQGAAFANADSISLVASEASASGTCTFQNEPFRTIPITSTSPCTDVTVTETFALHFATGAAGVASSLTHMSLTPATMIAGRRILLTG